jgi:hypothetical protein
LHDAALLRAGTGVYHLSMYPMLLRVLSPEASWTGGSHSVLLRVVTLQYLIFLIIILSPLWIAVSCVGLQVLQHNL